MGPNLFFPRWFWHILFGGAGHSWWSSKETLPGFYLGCKFLGEDSFKENVRGRGSGGMLPQGNLGFCILWDLFWHDLRSKNDISGTILYALILSASVWMICNKFRDIATWWDSLIQECYTINTQQNTATTMAYKGNIHFLVASTSAFTQWFISFSYIGSQVRTLFVKTFKLHLGTFGGGGESWDVWERRFPLALIYV